MPSGGSSTVSPPGQVGRREPGRVRRLEARRRHGQRTGDPLGDQVGQRPSGGAHQQHAEQVDAGLVHPAGARLESQRQARDPLDELVRRDVAVQRAAEHAALDHGSLQGRLIHDDAPAGGAREQVADGDRPLRGRGAVERGVRRHQHARLCGLGQPADDGVVERDRAVTHEGQRERSADRLGDRRDAELRVAAHGWAARFDAGASARAHVLLPAEPHGRDVPGHAAGLDLGVEHLPDALCGHRAVES